MPASNSLLRVPVALKVTAAGVAPAPADPDDHVVVPWWLAAAGGGAVASAAGWLVTAALVLLGWLSDLAGSMAAALGTATQLWFSGHGGWAVLSGTTWTMVPLGLVLLQLTGVVLVAGFAARQLRACTTGPARRGWAGVARVVGLVGLGYLLPLSAAVVLWGSPDQLARCLVGGGLLVAVGATVGASRTLGVGLGAVAPRWLRSLLLGVASALGLLVLVGLVTLGVAVGRHWDQVSALSTAAAPGTLGTAVLVLAQLAYLPNLVLWSLSYTFGAGFSVGTDSMVTPMVTELGLLPGLPVMAALPGEGIGTWTGWLWLLCGVAGGVCAAAVTLRGHRDLGVDASSLLGGLAGAVAGLAVTVLAALSRGSLGTGRLVEMGPRLPELSVMAVTVMGLSGLVAGLVVGMVRWRRWSAGSRRWLHGLPARTPE